MPFAELLDCVKANHGYTIDSAQVRYLLEVLCSLDSSERRAFNMFLTGSPNLPVGGKHRVPGLFIDLSEPHYGCAGVGLAALKPPLTVVRKDSADGADATLPSVMTCQNYLKLPPYSSQEVLGERLKLAMKEGQGSFDLS